ncbi:MAG: HrcA family transcriptional regulator, partial [Peptococcaceae bacterium]|nr:HrcA family transcriptional regulator [Peptococcaceae bacterium]
MRMEDRKKKVLEAIILDYIATAEPVGSRTISKKYDLGVSPATVRNEMADLEEMGLIEQPHTSAGRIPSQIGYRYYVDYLMEKETVTDEIKKYIRLNLLDQIRVKEDLMKNAVRLLSQISNYTALLILPAYHKNVLTHIQLLPLAENKLV